MIRAALIACAALTADRVLADMTLPYGGLHLRPSTVTIAPHRRCAAELTIRNAVGDTDNRRDHLELVQGPLVVVVQTFIGAADAPDTVEALPPAGFLAIPPSQTVPENGTAVILICACEGVGA